ncbi:MAG: SusC/RagA family TonB-linked outer membrane protein [Williamsia sp.]|nr:SusC/RagA family TonB-linked outer membrane protein [Williamsia sp.]
MNCYLKLKEIIGINLCSYAKLRHTLLIFLCIFYAGSMYAQNVILKGSVQNKNGEALSAATIRVKGTTVGTATSNEGKFTLSIPSSVKKPALVISMVNYETVEVSTEGQQDIEIVLQAAEKAMDEVVVTGYTNQKKENVTGSVGVVSSKQLVDVNTPNVGSLLQGKVAGVDVVTNSGRPGSSSSISIRGRSTINSTTAPLWVVDGTIMSSEPALNPADIESISVLKDASSAALYGSRAANGVIVVTTKMAKGTTDKRDFQVSGRTGITAYRMGNFRLMNSTQLYDYWKSFANQSAIPAYFNESLKQRNTDWVDIGSQNALSKDYNASYTGVSGKTRLFTSFNYRNEDGTVKGYEYNRLTGRINLDYKISDKITIKPKLAVAFTNTDDREHSIYDMFRDLPWDRPYDSSGKVVNARGNGVTWYGRDLNNYLYDLQWNYGKGQNLSLISNFDAQYDISSHFVFKSTNNITYLSGESMTYVDPRSLSGQADVGRISNTGSKATTRFTNQMLTYKTKFGDHLIDALVAYEYNDYKNTGYTATGKGIVPGVTVLNGVATPIATAGNITEYAFRSYLFNTSYSYSNRYTGQFSVRRDGSSRFAKQYGTFYSAGVAWNIHNENFFKVPSINYLRIRANYGGTGNTPSSFYGYYDLFSVSTQYNGSPSAFPTVLGTQDLSWEKTYSADAGVEIGLFNRLNITVDVYNRNTSDLIYSVALPAVSGYNNQLRNIGSVINRGIDASINCLIIRSEKVQWSIDVLFGRNRNHITELYQGKSQLNGNQIYKQGEDINTWYLPKWASVNPENGNPQWEVLNAANGSKTLTGTYSSATLQVAGTATPDFFGGLNTNLSFGGFSVKATSAFRQGSLVYHSDRETFDNDGAYPTYNNMVLRKGWSRWTPENRNATHPLAYYGGNNNSNKPSTRYLEDGSFYRIRNITVGYTLPSTLFHRWGLKGIGTYVSLDNLATFTKFSGLDPETISYPQPKRIIFGLSVDL